MIRPGAQRLPPLVLLHGFTNTGRVWDPFVDEPEGTCPACEAAGAVYPAVVRDFLKDG